MLSARGAEIPIIDTHIHLFDPRRPEGVPWPPKTNTVLYKPALPDRYIGITKSLGIVGAIEVEASPLVEDNQWVLDIAAKNNVIVGMIGSLEPGNAEFAKNLDRFRRNPLFLGIRYGNLWGRDLARDVDKPAVAADLNRLSDAGLTMDSANPNPALLDGILRLSDRLPNLRIVVDHLPQMNPGASAGQLEEFRKRPQIYVKLSEVFRRVDGNIPPDLEYYRATLDRLFETFGEDRVLYGSDWPNSDSWRPYADVLALVKKYFESKGATAAEKYFWKNSIQAYRWKKRSPDQPST